MQAILVASGAIPLHRFAARRLSPALGVMLAYAYILYAPLHGALFFDFHFQPIAAAFILWMIDMFDERRTALFVLFFILAISCREDISVGLACFGLFLMLTGHRTRAGRVDLRRLGRLLRDAAVHHHAAGRQLGVRRDLQGPLPGRGAQLRRHREDDHHQPGLHLPDHADPGQAALPHPGAGAGGVPAAAPDLALAGGPARRLLHRADDRLRRDHQHRLPVLGPLRRLHLPGRSAGAGRVRDQRRWAGSAPSRRRGDRRRHAHHHLAGGPSRRAPGSSRATAPSTSSRSRPTRSSARSGSRRSPPGSRRKPSWGSAIGSCRTCRTTSTSTR